MTKISMFEGDLLLSQNGKKRQNEHEGTTLDQAWRATGKSIPRVNLHQIFSKNISGVLNPGCTRQKTARIT